MSMVPVRAADVVVIVGTALRFGARARQEAAAAPSERGFTKRSRRMPLRERSCRI